MARVKEPKINPDFAFFIKPLDAEERTKLRQSIIEDGIREPIVLWEETGEIVDGHNRYDISKELKIPCPTRVKSFKNADEVLLWMADNQLGRRNANEETKAYLRGKEYLSNRRTEILHNLNGSLDLGKIGLPDCQSDNPGESTAEKLAKKHGVSASTIMRDAAFAQGVDASPDKKEILAGTSGKTMTEVRNSAPVFCRTCRIGTPKKDCEACADLRGGKRKKAAKKKVGAMKYDWPNFKKKIGEIVRSIDAVAHGYDRKGSVEHKKAIALMGDFVNHMRLWEKELVKGA